MMDRIYIRQEQLNKEILKMLHIKAKVNKQNGYLHLDSDDAETLLEELKYMVDESRDHESMFTSMIATHNGLSNIKGVLVYPKTQITKEHELLYQYNVQEGDIVVYKGKRYIVVGVEIEVAGLSCAVYVVKEGVGFSRRFKWCKVFRDEQINDLKLIV